MFDITNNQRPVNKHHNEMSPYTCQNGYYKKNNKEQVLARMYRKGNPRTLLVGMQNGATTRKTLWSYFKKLKIEHPKIQQFHFWVQAYIRDIAGAVPDHHDKVHIIIKSASQMFWFLSTYENYVYTIVN